ncbi:hypothetical protein BG015_008139 [Linnemannia schmuckeri]|uniref:Uncharacterized protein n=1 Tax=Linnemannia schmuckeri TaxID=64567 RepID=A0A9P5S6I7_9FUNG|nr:hypothetical protein BG015_008139 [Linnemannia schmuckeri]
MPLFKLNASSFKKNKTTSAASTPAQTPRTSFDGKAPATTSTDTPATQTSQAAAAKALGNMQAMVLSRV